MQSINEITRDVYAKRQNLIKKRLQAGMPNHARDGLKEEKTSPPLSQKYRPPRQSRPRRSLPSHSSHQGAIQYLSMSIMV